jgi:2-haloalkanoic acid dehalogenase type II
MQLTDFKALTFDCYGTLIDWETGILENLRPLVSRVEKTPTRDEVLATHGRYESSQQIATPTLRYSELLAVVYKRLAEEWRVPAAWDECLAYGDSIGNWPAFADSAASLEYLGKFYRLVILSNVDNVSFSRSEKKLGIRFDAVYTAGDIGSYKPSLRNFDYMITRLQGLGVVKPEILHTAESLFHDHAPANQIGLASCWIHRRHGQEGFGATMNPGVQPTYDFRFNSLAEFVAKHRELVGR